MANGLSAFHVGEFIVLLGVKLFVEVSVKNAPDTAFNNKDVFATVDNGLTGDVKLVVYTHLRT